MIAWDGVWCVRGFFYSSDVKNWVGDGGEVEEGLIKLWVIFTKENE